MRLIKYIMERKRVGFFILALGLVIGMHWLALTIKILTVEPEAYRKLAVDLEITSEYRYGYILGWHGAALVKTPNAEKGMPTVSGEISTNDRAAKGTLPGSQSTDKDDAGGASPEDQNLFVPDVSVESMMRNELNRVPMKFALELSLYLAILLYVFFGVRWIGAKLKVDQWRDIGQCLCMAASWIGFWMLVFIPYGMYGYGYPIHSNWMGPGAWSYSHSPLTMSTGNGLTISYRYVIDSLSIYPLMLYAFLAYLYQYVPVIGSQVPLSLSVAGPLFYGLGGALYILRKNRTEIWITFKRSFILIVCALLMIVLPFPPWRQPEWVRKYIDAVLSIIAKILFPWLFLLIVSSSFLRLIGGK